MSTITIIGNVTRDTYLALDANQATLETAQQGIPVLVAPFDNRHNLKYFQDTTTLGGSAITQDIFGIFEVDCELIGDPMESEDPTLTDRYILTANNHPLHLFPSRIPYSPFVVPDAPPDYIYIDRSASLDLATARAIINYLHAHRGVKLALFVSKRFETTDHPYETDLIARADIIISDINLDTASPTLHITERLLSYGHLSVELQPTPKNRLMTTLTSNTLIAAAFLAARIRGLNPSESLLYAKATLENSTLTASPSLQKLKEITMDHSYTVKSDPTKDKTPEIERTARTLMTPGKGILAADESGGSIKKKFDEAGIPDEEQTRRNYRNVFFSTPGIEKYLSGIILFDETTRQHADSGENFVKHIASLGIVPGVKVDQGLEPIPESPEETYTKGLDGLSQRMAEYYKLGCRFAKWRAAFTIADGIPTDEGILQNCEILAEYAKVCQENNIVPIVEPEVVYDGDYTIRASAEVTSRILNKLFEQLKQRQVNLKGCILKVNMCLAGKRYEIQSSTSEVGKTTADVLKSTVPEELAGVVFLSGGQTPTQATENLAEIVKNGPFPWYVTYSYARAIQQPVLDVWANKPENIPDAQKALIERLQANQAATGDQHPSNQAE